MSELIYKEEAYEIVGICMEVHNELGPGLLEIIYKESVFSFLSKDVRLYSVIAYI